jgi:DNA-binding MarR family transcriptional regulator
MSKSQFTKELAKLRAADLIISSRIEFGDRRGNELTLTDEGIKILEKIQEQRRELLAFLFQKRTKIELKTVADALEAVALATWPKIKEAITDLPSTTPASAKSKAKKRRRSA